MFAPIAYFDLLAQIQSNAYSASVEEQTATFYSGQSPRGRYVLSRGGSLMGRDAPWSASQTLSF